ncbi:hypothetical protein [Plantactinospora soyae]|uniref:Peptidase M23 n=1 Tax=Plantactinospora soyae TaxID=1544732 RepID=A0A927R6T5_9ACTN|nr:hypothetical protein [Plantactinospora soyae]MBE1488774.1 hypothetical protein [Plantactinospora soyae]
MPDDDRSETVNAAKPGTVRSAEAPSADPASPPERTRPTASVLLRSTLLLARLWALLRTGAARLRRAIEPGLLRLRRAVEPGLLRLRRAVAPGVLRLRRAVAPTSTRLRASGSVLRRAVAGLARPALVRARRFAAFRAAERVLHRTLRLAAPWARRFAARANLLAVRVGLRTPHGVRRPARVAVAAGVLCCLGAIAVVGAAGQPDSPTGASAANPDDRVALSRPTTSPGEDSPDRSSRSAERDRPGAGGSSRSTGSDRSDSPDSPLVDAAPVAGLSDVQMNNARAIVRTGRDMGMPRRALVIGVATAMQESNLLNRASEVLPESKRYPHQGSGWDHDSVGLFQQRTSSGWGPVNRLMDPAYATARFFDALRQVPGWERMRLTEAAQAVQVSAYPEHYAKHEGEAAQVVEALVPSRR